MQRKKIVVVEDDFVLLKTYENIVKQSCDFYGFIKAKDALHFLQNEPEIDLLIIDRSLPDMTGDDLCAYLRSQPFFKFLPIIMISAQKDIDDIAEIMEKMSINTYITKPISVKTLRKHIISFL